MQILHVYKDFEPTKGGGGVARHIHALAKLQAQKGHMVCVSAFNPEKTNSSYYAVDIKSLKILEEFNKADIVHLHGARMPLTALLSILAFIRRKHVAYTPHCYYDNGGLPNKIVKFFWDQTVERFLARISKPFILLNPSWLSYLEKKGIYSNNYTVIPNCVSSVAIEATKTISKKGSFKTLGAPNVFYIGRLDPVKRLDDLLVALADKRLINAHLHVVGKGDDRDRLLALAQELGISDRVTFYGALSDTDSFSLALSCDVYVLPSQEEGLPTAILEMILIGIPVICTKIPGNLAITERVGISSTYDVGDINSLVKLICKYKTLTLSQDSVSLTHHLFTWEKQVENVLDSYQSVK